jgi:hypothetical protein
MCAASKCDIMRGRQSKEVYALRHYIRTSHTKAFKFPLGIILEISSHLAAFSHPRTVLTTGFFWPRRVTKYFEQSDPLADCVGVKIKKCTVLFSRVDVDCAALLGWQAGCLFSSSFISLLAFLLVSGYPILERSRQYFGPKYLWLYVTYSNQCDIITW